MHFAVPSIGFFPCSFFSVRKENLNDWGRGYTEYVSFGGSPSFVGAWVVEVVGRADTVQCLKAVWGFFLFVFFFLPLSWDLCCYLVCLWALGFCHCRESAQLSLCILSGDKNTWHWSFLCLTDCTVRREIRMGIHSLHLLGEVSVKKILMRLIPISVSPFLPLVIFPVRNRTLYGKVPFFQCINKELSN